MCAAPQDVSGFSAAVLCGEAILMVVCERAVLRDESQPS